MKSKLLKIMDTFLKPNHEAKWRAKFDAVNRGRNDGKFTMFLDLDFEKEILDRGCYAYTAPDDTKLQVSLFRRNGTAYEITTFVIRINYVSVFTKKEGDLYTDRYQVIDALRDCQPCDPENARKFILDGSDAFVNFINNEFLNF